MINFKEKSSATVAVALIFTLSADFIYGDKTINYKSLGGERKHEHKHIVCTRVTNLAMIIKICILKVSLAHVM